MTEGEINIMVKKKKGEEYAWESQTFGKRKMIWQEGN